MAELDAASTVARQRTKGLLLTADPSLARSFLREIDNLPECRISFELQSNFDEAMRSGGGPYLSVVVDLDGAMSPDAAVRVARQAWPFARIAVLTYWWSEQSELARDSADLVIHKPLRAAELRAFLRSPAGPPTGTPAHEEAALAAVANA